MRTKQYYTDLDTIFNTGIYKGMFFEILLMFVMPYPSLYNTQYTELANDRDPGVMFQWNDFLLCFCIFFRIHLLVTSILSLSVYTEPRSQRVCNIYGCDANFNFALKALMKESPKVVLGSALVTALLMFSY
jgi:hypothetical protein